MVHGVTQGSVFGPVLFLLCRSDLPLQILGAKLILFVSDTILVTERDESALCYKITNVMD
jgi:hypothetical protein